MLKLEGVQKHYGDHRALAGLSLDIPAGIVFGFLGQNGAGKTTTMKIIAGLIQASNGRVIIDHVETTSDPVTAKSKVGYIPDRPYLYDRLTGTETMEFIAELFNLDRDIAQQTAEQLLQRFGIHHAKDKHVETYSHLSLIHI